MDDLPGWQRAMLDELSHKRFIDAWVRIHDSGDFYSRAYLAAWLEIMRARQQTRFYAYTKEVAAFRELVEPWPATELLVGLLLRWHTRLHIGP